MTLKSKYAISLGLFIFSYTTVDIKQERQDALGSLILKSRLEGYGGVGSFFKQPAKPIFFPINLLQNMRSQNVLKGSGKYTDVQQLGISRKSGKGFREI